MPRREHHEPERPHRDERLEPCHATRNQHRGHVEQHERERKPGRPQQAPAQREALALTCLRLGIFGSGVALGVDHAVAGTLHGGPQVGPRGAGRRAHGRTLGGQVDAGRHDAGHGPQRTLDAPGAGGARHAREDERRLLGPHVVARRLDGLGEGRERRGGGVEANARALGGEVDRRFLHAGRPGERLLDAARRTRRTSCPRFRTRRSRRGPPDGSPGRVRQRRDRAGLLRSDSWWCD